MIAVHIHLVAFVNGKDGDSSHSVNLGIMLAILLGSLIIVHIFKD